MRPIMRVLVLYAHPLETSFLAMLHMRIVEILRLRQHQVDDLDSMPRSSIR
jgi:NAD(P)H dehydrogenase (quinone)